MDRPPARRHIQPMQYTVTVAHDEEEGVWFVQHSDVPGLNAEAPTLDGLVEAVTDLAADLIAANVPGASIGDGAAISLRVEHLVNARRAPAA
jgi:predicted RNase H-like HicB family nuclease